MWLWEYVTMGCGCKQKRAELKEAVKDKDLPEVRKIIVSSLKIMYKQVKGESSNE